MDVGSISSGALPVANQAAQVKLQKGALEQQGKVVMALLESTEPSAPTSPGVGTKLNVTA